MLKILLQFKDSSAKLLVCSSTLMLLLATLLITISLQLDTFADTNRFLFGVDALKDPGSLAVKLQDTRAAVSTSIAAQLSVETQQLLNEYDGASSPSLDLQKALLADLNRMLQTQSLYDAQLFAGIQLSEQTQALIAQNSQGEEAGVRLNRCLLADVYPYELVSLSAQQNSEDSKGIETCRENLRQIKRACEDYRASNADTDTQWLSELFPQYLEKAVLLCPADPTAGVPGVLTDGAADPTLPCSYLYEIRHTEKVIQGSVLMGLGGEGDMRPIVRCEHHLLNLSIGGKLYRNGPQRSIYNSNKTEISLLTDFMRDLQRQLGEDFLKTQEGREKLKRATQTLIIKQLMPKVLSASKENISSQLEAQLGKDILKTPSGMGILKQALTQLNDHIEKTLVAQLEARLGEEFIKTEEGQDILNQLSESMSH
jgi:hypothetical protein